jgi:hypothetical protein
MVFARFVGEAKLEINFVDNFDYINFAIEAPDYLENYINFFSISALLVQKLASAIAANPNYNIDLNPPIILNHS